MVLKVEEKVMTEAEAVAALNKIANQSMFDVHTTVVHMRADKILLEVLCEAGFTDVCEAFTNAKDRKRFWYV